MDLRYPEATGPGAGAIDARLPGEGFPNPKLIFRRELKPALKREAEAGEFARLMRTYEVALNAAAWDTSLHEQDRDVVNSARLVVGNIGARKELKSVVDDPAVHDGLVPAYSSALVEDAVSEHTQKIYDWFAKHYPGMDTLLSSYMQADKQKEAELHNLIGDNVSHWINLRSSMGAVNRKELEQKYLQQMGEFVLRNAPFFHDLSRATPTDGSVLVNADQTRLSALADVQILEGIEGVAAFKTKDWLATTAMEARTKGRKVYETPYYASLIKELLFRSNKQNGVGGTILYGPPGTGKTELQTEVNRILGFETRVINIHHYTTFEDLIAGKVVQIGMNRNAAVAEQIKTVLEVFEKEDPQEFKKYVSSLFSKLQEEGKVREDETLTDFLRSFVTTETQKLLEERELTNDDWQTIKGDFIQTQKMRILRTVLPSSYQELVEDIVRGEILLAMRNGERVTLDELDKAGPNSLGGILSFLAKSPGEYMEYGQVREQIPSWFRINATSNSTELDEYLKNRFGHMPVNTPPVKDQLMIATVRLSDHQGNIQLNEYEQRQLVGFFTQIAPAVNAVLTELKIAPLANRDVQHLTSFLVDSAAMRRTDVPFSQAVNKFLAERTLGTPEALDKINKALVKFKGILDDQIIDFRLPPASAAEFDNRKTALAASFEAGLKQVQESPVIQAINGLGNETAFIEHPKVRPVNLSDKQKQEVLKLPSAPEAKGDKRLLPTGLVLETDMGAGKNPEVRIWGASESDSQTHVLARETLPSDGRLITASADGRVVVLANQAPNNPDQEQINIIQTFQVQQNTSKDTFSRDNQVQINATGSKVCVLDTSTHVLKIFNGGTFKEVGSDITSFEISKNGHVILATYKSGDSSVISAQTLKAIAFLPGEDWHFVGDKLLVSKKGDRVGETAYALT